MIILGVIFLIMSAFLFVLTVKLSVISFHFRPKYCSCCKGYLQKTTQYRNKYVGGKNGRWYKHYIDYTYVYRVDGKAYEISDGSPGTKSNLRTSVDVVYQIKNPKYAYIRNPHPPIVPLLMFGALILFSASFCFGILFITL